MDCCAHEGPGGGDARFDIQQVADGVHVAVAAPAYKVNCNTAIIETDDGLIVVDTHSKPSAARVIVSHLRDLSPQPVRYVVNTHFHWDHWHGNEVYPKAYPGAEIVTNQITREAMVKKGLKRIQDHVRQVPAEIARLEAELASARGPEERTRVAEHLRLARPWRDVDLDVELAELGLEVRVGDQLEHVRVRHRRVAGLLGQVELDLEPDRAPVGVEARLGEHAREHVEAALDLLAVALAVVPGEDGRGDLVTHGRSITRTPGVPTPNAGLP